MMVVLKRHKDGFRTILRESNMKLMRDTLIYFQVCQKIPLF